MKPYINFFLVLILVVSMVSAIDTDVSFQFNTKYDLKRPCFNNGAFCSDGATCNITIIYPNNGDFLINNKLMTNQGSIHNITVQQVSNNRLGVYPVITSCTDGAVSGEDTFNIEITGDGKPSQTFPTQFFAIILSFVLIGIGFLSDRLRIMKHAGGMLLMIMGVVTLYPGYSFINYSTLMGKGMGFSFIGMGFYFLVEDSFSRDKQDEHFELGEGGGEDEEKE